MSGPMSEYDVTIVFDILVSHPKEAIAEATRIAAFKLGEPEEEVLIEQMSAGFEVEEEDGKWAFTAFAKLRPPF